MKSRFRAVPLRLYFDTWRPSALSKQSVGGPGQVVSGKSLLGDPTTSQVPPLFLTTSDARQNVAATPNFLTAGKRRSVGSPSCCCDVTDRTTGLLGVSH